MLSEFVDDGPFFDPFVTSVIQNGVDIVCVVEGEVGIKENILGVVINDTLMKLIKSGITRNKCVCRIGS